MLIGPTERPCDNPWVTRVIKRSCWAKGIHNFRNAKECQVCCSRSPFLIWSNTIKRVPQDRIFSYRYGRMIICFINHTSGSQGRSGVYWKSFRATDGWKCWPLVLYPYLRLQIGGVKLRWPSYWGLWTISAIVFSTTFFSKFVRFILFGQKLVIFEIVDFVDWMWLDFECLWMKCDIRMIIKRTCRTVHEDERILYVYIYVYIHLFFNYAYNYI